MAKLKIGGNVLYNDLQTPVPNTVVQIYDLDPSIKITSFP
jgi:hypothetical protein